MDRGFVRPVVGSEDFSDSEAKTSVALQVFSHAKAIEGEERDVSRFEGEKVVLYGGKGSFLVF